MREKTILIKGISSISRELTKNPEEIINADNVFLITALRHPEHLPDYFETPQKILDNTFVVMNYWENNNNTHLLMSEYASILTEKKYVKIVEGESLWCQWFYDS